MGRRLGAGILVVAAAAILLLPGRPSAAGPSATPAGTVTAGAGSSATATAPGSFPLGGSTVPTAVPGSSAPPTSDPPPSNPPARDWTKPGPIPRGAGKLFRKDFRDGRLWPFRILTYPNDHPGDRMIKYGTFVSDSKHISVHDGYLDLRATRRADGTYAMALVGTGLDGKGHSATFTFRYGTARVMARMNSGTAAWQTLWYLVGDRWDTIEIDWGEIIGNDLRAYIHTPSNALHGSKITTMRAPRADEWHEYGITKTPTYIAFELDGVEVARYQIQMTSKMALLADAKVGLDTPDANTPKTLFLNVAWWVVDPLP